MNEKNIVKSLLIFLIFSTIADFIYLLSIPSDSKNRVLWGFSLNRLLLLAFFVLVMVGLVWLLIANLKHSLRFNLLTAYVAKHSFCLPGLIAIFFLSSLICLSAFLAPAYILQAWQPILVRLRPFFLWTQSFTTAIIVLTISSNLSKHPISEYSHPHQFKSFFITATVVMLIFLIIAFGYPKLTDELWFGRYSVPILITQIAAIWVIVTLGMQIYDQFRPKLRLSFLKKPDLLISLFIWVFAALLLVQQPIDFMDDMYYTTIEQNIKPMAPNYQIYPRKDSQTYFNVSESIVMGEGIYRSIDKSLFLTFEGFNNWINHGDYEKMLNFQTVILALFPTLIYLLGKHTHSRWAGLLGAAFAIFHERNGILLMDELPVVSSKVLLTEPFMQLWTALIALVLVIAFKNNRESQHRVWFFISGGILGLSALFRLNTLVILPFILVFILINFFRNRKQLVSFLCVLSFGLLIALAPWMAHNAIKYDDPFAFIKGKVEGVILDKRYEKITGQAGFTGNQSPSVKTASSSLENIRFSLTPLISSGENSKYEENNISIKSVEPESLPLSGAANYGPLSITILRHFANNVATTFSILPTSFAIQDLFHAARTQPFWGEYDAALYEGIDYPLVILNLILIALGISSAFSKFRLTGLLPLAVYTGYTLSNALAVSSGNRYSQPVAWVVYFYFALGLITISQWFLGLINNRAKLQPKDDKIAIQLPAKIKNMKSGWIASLCLVLLIGGTPVLADSAIPERFPEYTQAEILSALYENLGCQAQFIQAGYTTKDMFLEKFNTRNHFVSAGRFLMPLHLSQEEFLEIYGHIDTQAGDMDSFTTFVFLSPENRYIFQSGDAAVELPHGSDGFIIASGNQAEVIGLIDKEYASDTIDFINPANLPLKCYSTKNGNTSIE